MEATSSECGEMRARKTCASVKTVLEQRQSVSAPELKEVWQSKNKYLEVRYATVWGHNVCNAGRLRALAIAPYSNMIRWIRQSVPRSAPEPRLRLYKVTRCKKIRS